MIIRESENYVSRRFWLGYAGLHYSLTKVSEPNYFTTTERVIIDSQFPAIPATVDSEGSLTFTVDDSDDDYSGVVVWHGADYGLPYTLDTANLVDGDRFCFADDSQPPFLTDMMYYVIGTEIQDKDGNVITGASGVYNALNGNKYAINVLSSPISLGDTRTFSISNVSVNNEPGQPSYEWG